MHQGMPTRFMDSLNFLGADALNICRLRLEHVKLETEGCSICPIVGISGLYSAPRAG